MRASATKAFMFISPNGFPKISIRYSAALDATGEVGLSIGVGTDT
jgi:hypothetical protein